MWRDYLSVQFDPAHLLAELGFSIAFELAQLVLIVKWLKPRLHKRFDRDHNLTHNGVD